MHLRVGLRLPACDRADKVAAAVGYAEDKGFDSVWIPDSQLLWRDTFSALSLAAATTTRIILGTGVTNLVTRHVSVVASAARTVQELAPDRFILALGAGRSAADMIGSASTRTGQLEVSIGALRALLSGEPWSFGGAPERLNGALGPCPIYLGATGPRNTRLACDLADGIILTGGLCVTDVTGAVSMIRQRVAASPRPDRSFEVVVWIRVEVDDGRPAEPRRWKPAIAIALMNAPAAVVEDLDVDPGALRTATGLQGDGTHSADWSEAVASCDPLISDRAALAYARRYCLYGTPGEIEHQAALLAAAGVTTIITTPLAGDTTFTLPYDFMDAMATTGLIGAARAQPGSNQ